jgi:hypothetical protein
MPGAPDWREGVTYLYPSGGGGLAREGGLTAGLSLGCTQIKCVWLARDQDISLDADSDIAPCLIPR